MESDKQTSNSRQKANSNLPAITLAVLIALIIALLYIGYEGIADNTKGSEEITNVPVDTTERQAGNQDLEEPELIGPEDVDTSTAPVPVDLSQAPAPPDESTAEMPAAPARKPATDPTGTGKTENSADETPKADKPVAEKPKAEKPAPRPEPVAEKPKPVPEPAPTRVVVNPGGTTTRHTVTSGETFYSVANRYNMKLSTLKALNPNVSETDVKSGVTKLNLKVKAVHTVGSGDVLRVVAEKYGVSKEAIMRANNKSKDIAKRGEKLIIPFGDRQ